MSSHRHHKGHHKVLSPWRLIFFTMLIFNESLENYLYHVTQYCSRSDKEIRPFAIQYNTIQYKIIFSSTIKYRTLTKIFKGFLLREVESYVSSAWSTVLTLPYKCPYLELFWSVFSRIWTEYEDFLYTSLYSVRMQENTG